MTARWEITDVEYEIIHSPPFDTLFHYCSNSTFHSIISSGTIRLSSMTMSNDYMEGELIGEALIELCKKEKVSDEFTKDLLQNYDFFKQMFSGMAFCLSENGDLLSQWRGYAGDGTGFSIGFSTEHLWNMMIATVKPTPSGFNSPAAFTFQKVHYSKNEHIEFVRPFFEKAKQVYAEVRELSARKNDTTLSNADRRTARRACDVAASAFPGALAGLVHKVFLMKSDAFSEEKEWRLLKKSDPAGKFQYRPTANSLVPFESLVWSNPTAIGCVNEIIIGPKNVTPEPVLKGFLRSCGLGEVPVRRSVITYR